MNSFFLCFLFAFLQVRISYQAPVLPLEPSPPSLRDLVRERPARTTSEAGITFSRQFAMHPEIADLRNLNAEQYADNALKLRQSFGDDMKLREKFRKALIHHMEKVHKPDTRSIKSVKDKFAKVAKRESDCRNIAKQKEKDLEGFTLKRKAIDARCREKKRQKRLRSELDLGEHLEGKTSQPLLGMSAQHSAVSSDDILYGGNRFDESEWWNDI
jgi:hypothetical protein